MIPINTLGIEWKIYWKSKSIDKKSQNLNKKL